MLRQHFILMVRKRAGSGASEVWPHLCAHTPALQAVFPTVKIACIDGIQAQSLSSQVQMFASASLVVLPHGGMLHLCNFARNGASVIALVDNDQVSSSCPSNSIIASNVTIPHLLAAGQGSAHACTGLPLVEHMGVYPG